MGNIVTTNFLSCDNLNLETITDVNEIVRCVKDLQGLPSDSASTTDVYILKFNDGSKYNGEEIDYGFQKLFISKIKENTLNPDSGQDKFIDLPDDIKANSIINMNDGTLYPNSTINFKTSQVIKYEYYVYKLKIAPLLYYNISPHFIKFLGGLTETNYSNIIEYLKDGTGKGDVIETNFKRNFLCMIDNIEKRKAIQDDNQDFFIYNEDLDVELRQKLITLKKYTNDLYDPKNYQYGFILNEAIRNSKAGKKREIGESVTLKNWFDSDFDEKELDNIIFQVLQGCCAMYYSGVVHNDLHYSNVYIKKIPKTNIRYIIDKKEYIISTENMVMIYDFDRSFIPGFENNLLKGSYYAETKNQVNELREGKDFIKNMFYVLYKLKEKDKDEEKKLFNRIQHVTLKNISNKGSWDIRLKDAFLRDYPKNPYIKDDDWNLLSSYAEMVDKFYTGISNKIDKDITPDLVYTLDKEMFNDKGYLTPYRISKVYSKIYNNDQQKLKKLQQDLDNLQGQYDELLEIMEVDSDITSDEDIL